MILQLSVAERQQPMRGTGSRNLQPVVASTDTVKQLARRAFANRLNLELDRIGVPDGRQRIGWLHRTLKNKGKPLVSREQVRKWVRGVDIPDQANLAIIVEQLKLDWGRLQTGDQPDPADELRLELQAAWEALDSDRKRLELIRYANYLAQPEEPKSTVARPEGSESEGERASLQRVRRI